MCKDPEEQAKADAKLRAEGEARQLNDLQRAVGFRRVVEEIIKAGKPVICHNGLLVRSSFAWCCPCLLRVRQASKHQQCIAAFENNL